MSKFLDYANALEAKRYNNNTQSVSSVIKSQEEDSQNNSPNRNLNIQANLFNDAVKNANYIVSKYTTGSDFDLYIKSTYGAKDSLKKTLTDIYNNRSEYLKMYSEDGLDKAEVNLRSLLTKYDDVAHFLEDGKQDMSKYADENAYNADVDAKKNDKRISALDTDEVNSQIADLDDQINQEKYNISLKDYGGATDEHSHDTLNSLTKQRQSLADDLKRKKELEDTAAAQEDDKRLLTYNSDAAQEQININNQKLEQLKKDNPSTPNTYGYLVPIQISKYAYNYERDNDEIHALEDENKALQSDINRSKELKYYKAAYEQKEEYKKYDADISSLMQTYMIDSQTLPYAKDEISIQKFNKGISDSKDAIIAATGWSEQEFIKQEKMYEDIKSQENSQNYNEDVEDFAKKHGFIASVASVVTNLGSGFGYFDAIMQDSYNKANGLDDRPINANTPGFALNNYTNIVRNTVRNEQPGELGKTMYDITMSVADSAATMALGTATASGFGAAAGSMAARAISGSVVNLIVGSQVATSEFKNAINNGYSAGDALAIGTLKGVVDGLTSAVSADYVIGKIHLGTKGFGQWLAKTGASAFAGGSQAVAVNYLNRAVDSLAAGKDLTYEKFDNIYKDEVASGSSKPDALFKALWESGVKQDTAAFFQGGIVSGVISAIGSAVHTKTRLSDQDEYALRITDDQIQSERASGNSTFAKYLEGLRDNARVEDGKRIERDAILKQYPLEKLQELAKNGDYDTISFVNAKLKALDKRTDFEADNSFYKNLSIENSQKNAALENGNNVKVAMPEYAMSMVGGNGIEGAMGAENETGANGFGGITDSAGQESGFNGGNDGLHNDLNNPTTNTPGAMPESGMENPVGKDSQGITPDSTVSENSIKAESVDGKNRGEYNNINDSVKYYRVQGGGSGKKTSQYRIIANEDGSISIPNKKMDLNISAYDEEHAQYFRNTARPDGDIVEFQVPKYLDDLIKENLVVQYGFTKNPLNQGGMAPKLVDPTTPGTSYELPASPWAGWLEEYAHSSRIIK